MEFSLGGDPALPIRVLASFPTSSDVSENSSGSSDEEEDELVQKFDFRRRFFDLTFGPAVARLSRSSLSRMKGAGDPFVKKWHLRPSDWRTFHLRWTPS